MKGESNSMLRPNTSDGQAVPFGSNEVRLSPRDWVVALIIIAVSFCLVPILWQKAVGFDVERDYRVPYSLGNDYWLFNRYCRAVRATHKTVVIGDSVIWGHYVGSKQTLSHYLNELTRHGRFNNLGIDGIHPAAMAGLIRYYGRAVSGKKVILHCNLLWMSSKKHDLQTEKEFSFNHPALVPQFFPNIPCYRESYSGRIGIVVGRRLPFYGWVEHLHTAYFGNMDIHSWTGEHPYDNPLRAVTLELPSPDEPVSPKPVAKSWTSKGISKFGATWVELDTSLQWKSFRRMIQVLESRGNKVFVLVGPFNEHMLTEESLQTYGKRKSQIESWLRENNIPYCIPAALPSERYADASHPLSDGYALLARQLFENGAFAEFITNHQPSTIDH